MIRYRGRATTYGEVWYDEAFAPDCGVDVLLCRQRSAPVAGGRVTPWRSLVVDLTRGEDAIMDDFGKDCGSSCPCFQRWACPQSVHRAPIPRAAGSAAGAAHSAS